MIKNDRNKSGLEIFNIHISGFKPVGDSITDDTPADIHPFFKELKVIMDKYNVELIDCNNCGK